VGRTAGGAVSQGGAIFTHSPGEISESMAISKTFNKNLALKTTGYEGYGKWSG
jgi:hypothetical protein